MKKFMLSALMLLSMNAFSQTQDYSCEIRRYRLDITLTNSTSTSMWLTDTFNYSTIAHGYAGSIARSGDKTIFSFYPGQASPMKLTFKTQDILDFPAVISGNIDTMAGGFLLIERMNCHKR